MLDLKRLALFLTVGCLLAGTLDAKPRKGERYLQEGRDAEARKQWELALELYEKAVLEDPADIATMPHVDYVREAGSEGIELVMWLIARGAMTPGQAPTVLHRFFHVPASNTAVGHLILQDNR